MTLTVAHARQAILKTRGRFTLRISMLTCVLVCGAALDSIFVARVVTHRHFAAALHRHILSLKVRRPAPLQILTFCSEHNGDILGNIFIAINVSFAAARLSNFAFAAHQLLRGAYIAWFSYRRTICALRLTAFCCYAFATHALARFRPAIDNILYPCALNAPHGLLS